MVLRKSRRVMEVPKKLSRIHPFPPHRFSIPIQPTDHVRLKTHAKSRGLPKTALARNLILAGLKILDEEAAEKEE